METAMQQHIEWLKATLDLCKENAPTLVNCISLCISDAESRLEMEKEQMKESFDAALYQDVDNAELLEFEQYYNNTFKSEMSCPKCYESENIHFNIDYSNYGSPDTKEFLCNECGTFFTIKSE